MYSLFPLKNYLYCCLNWYSIAFTSPLSAATDSLSSAPTVQSTTPPQHIATTDGRAILTTDPFTTFSSQSTHTVQDTNSTAHASIIQPQSESLTTATAQPTTTGRPLTSAPRQGPAGPTHREVPSELNIGDEGMVMSVLYCTLLFHSKNVFSVLLWLSIFVLFRTQGAPLPFKLPFRPPAGWSAVSVHRHHCYRLRHPLPQVPPANKSPRVPSAAGSTHGKIHMSITMQ